VIVSSCHITAFLKSACQKGLGLPASIGTNLVLLARQKYTLLFPKSNQQSLT